MTAGSFPRGSSVHVVLAVSACLSFVAPASAADTPAKPTFSKDVAPIFQAKCQECHQPNSIAPMSLITYQDARPWARSIKERVATRQMPPWHIDRSVGVQKFKNDMSLTRRAGRDHRPLGRRRVAAGRSERPAAAQAARDGQRVAGRARWIRKAGSRREVVRVHDAGRAPGRLVPADVRHPAERAALGEAGRDSSDQPQVAQDHPSLDRLSRPQQRSRRREHRDG